MNDVPRDARGLIIPHLAAAQAKRKAEVRADPRKAKSIEEACANGDGTFNGYRLMSYLSEAMNPGKGFSVEEVEAMARKGKVKTEKANEDRKV